MSDYSEWTHNYSLPENHPDYRNLDDDINDLIDEWENDDEGSDD
jgi:hypothetical protein